MDWTLVLIICGIVLAVGFCFCLAIANFGLAKFYDVYKKYNEEESYCKLSTLDMVNEINAREFGSQIRVHTIEQYAGDAYVRGGDLLLSTTTISSTSLASYAVLAHELGHALQDRDGNKLKVKSILSKLGKIVSIFLFPSLLAGLILMGIGIFQQSWLLYLGIGFLCFGVFVFILALVLRLYTISIEKEASKNAIILLKDYFSDKQLIEMKKLLNSAVLTYWAAFFQTLLGWTALTKKTKLFN